MTEPWIPPIKDAEPGDPMEFNGVALPGDTQDAMAECFVEEYMLQGFADDMILRLFTNPHYAGTHAYWQAKGDAAVKDLIARARAQWGHLRFRTDVTAAGLAPDPEDDAIEDAH